jgi:Fe-S cluster biogenesis protein NfuA
MSGLLEEAKLCDAPETEAANRELFERINEALDRVRPGIESHGGDVELIGVKDGVAGIRMSGACDGCPMSQMTLRMGIELVIREAAPEIEQVIPVRDEEDMEFI